MRRVQHEKVVEIAADLARRRHRRRQTEAGVRRKRHWQSRGLDCLGDHHVLCARRVLGGVKRLDAPCVI